MARSLASLTITVPSGNVNINRGASFTMTITGTFSGGGGINPYNLQFQWDQGTGAYVYLPSGSSNGLYSAGTTNYVGTTDDINTTPKSITVLGGAAGTFVIRASNGAAINSATRQVTVSSVDPPIGRPVAWAV